jgi:hypothetical protein
MAEEKAADVPRPRGEAAWKAERAATEQRNSDARKKAAATHSPTYLAAMGRERRLETAENAQLAALNKQIEKRQKQR